MSHKVKANTLVSIVFDDHVQGADEPMRCVVFGRVHSCNPKAITVKSWDYYVPTPALDHNIETFTILQSTIAKLTRHK